MSDYQPRIPVKIRTARKQYECWRCCGAIDPGDRYEVHTAAPWSDGNESPHWYTAKGHLSRPGRPLAGCEAAGLPAERRAAREQADGN